MSETVTGPGKRIREGKDPLSIHERTEHGIVATDEQIDALAAAVAERLHKSILQIPAEVAEYLKPWHGWQNITHICGGDWPYSLRSRITADGGIWLQVTTADGQPILERVLHP